jgi:hypothetical protein
MSGILPDIVTWNKVKDEPAMIRDPMDAAIPLALILQEHARFLLDSASRLRCLDTSTLSRIVDLPKDQVDKTMAGSGMVNALQCEYLFNPDLAPRTTRPGGW